MLGRSPSRNEFRALVGTTLHLEGQALVTSVAARRLIAGLLSMLVPGAGQLYRGARGRGFILLGLSAVFLVGVLELTPWHSFAAIDRNVLALLLALNVALLALRLYAVVDAWRGGQALHLHLALIALAALTAAPHVAAGYVAVRSYSVLEQVFAEDEPGDVLPAHGVFLVRRAFDAPPARYPLLDPWEHVVSRRLAPGESRPLAGSSHVLGGKTAAARPWTTILLLGTDEGPGNSGARTDTMILVAIQHGTGRAAAFGIPRNLADVPLGGVAAASSSGSRSR